MQNEISRQQIPLVEAELKAYARIIRRWLWLILLCAVLGGAIAYVVSQLSTSIYQATTTLLIEEARTPAVSYNDILTSERKARTYAELMTLDSTLYEVAERLGVEQETIEQAITDVHVAPLRDTQLVQIDVEGTSPELVALVANLLPTVFIEELGQVQTERYAESKANLQELLDELSVQIEQVQVSMNAIGEVRTPQEEVELTRLQNALTQYQNNYANLLQNYETLRLAEVQSTDSILVAEPAAVPTDPIRPRVLINVVLAIVVSLMLVLGVVFLIEYLDDGIKSPFELQNLVALPLLGAVVPFETQDDEHRKMRPGGLIAIKQPRDPVSEAYRNIRTNLQFANIDGTLKTLLVTSAVSNEGKTTTAANLAAVLAQSGLRVALVDADLHKPNIHKLFGVSIQPGFIDGLLSDEPAPLRYCAQQNVQKNLHVIPCGQIPPNPSELLGSQRMHELLARLQEQVDLVIFDAPPILAVTDARVLATQVDGVLLVINRGTARGTFLNAVNALHYLNAPLLGTVFNRLERSTAGNYYYSDYYTDDRHPGGDDPDASGQKGRDVVRRPRPVASNGW